MRHLPALLAIPLLAAGCTADPGTAPDPTARPTSGTTTVAQQMGAVSIAGFNSCEDLLDYYIEGAVGLVGPYGLAGDMDYPEGDFAVDDFGAADAAEGGGLEAAGSSESQASSGDSGGFSGTNNQEQGVDEADTVKTNGDIIAAIAQNRLHIVDVDRREATSSLAIDELAPGAYQSEMLLNGETLVVISTGAVDDRPFWRPWLDSMGGSDDFMAESTTPGGGATRTTVTRLNISDPTAAHVLGSTRMEGTYRSARMIGDSVRIVMESAPSGLRFTYPTSGSLSAERKATDANRRIIEESTLEDWVPHAEAIDADGNRVSVEQLTDCSNISRPGAFSGLSTVSVVTFDIAQSDKAGAEHSAPTSSVGLVASGDTVYASTDRLIVATSPWGGWAMPFGSDIEPSETISTSLHSFDISDPDATTYVASGQVAGTVINQFALSEADGVIRVATTSEPTWRRGETASESTLFMLAQDGDALPVTGSVGGLGKTEQIKSVRYLSADVAAIVTFRQSDPLYLVDTSDPTDPEVTGELKIPGYSAYLHPINDEYLLGVGQDADPETGRESGLQASLFDISDLRNPERVDQLTWPGGYSPVEYDHRAFTAWAQTGHFFLPAEIYTEMETLECADDEDCAAVEEPSPTGNFGGVVTATIEGSALREGPRLPTSPDKDSYSAAAERTVVIGGALWTIHDSGMNRYDLDTLKGGPALSW